MNAEGFRRQQMHGARTAKSDQRFDASRRLEILIDQTTEETEEKKHDSRTNVEDNIKEVMNPKDEIKILKHWGILKKSLKLADVIDPLIEKGMFSPAQWMELKRNGKSDPDTVEDFLYMLIKSSSENYIIFIEALKSHGYSHLASQLEGHLADEYTPASSSSGSSVSSRKVGRPPTVGRIYSRQALSGAVSIPDPRNGAAGAITEERETTLDSTVKQEDLIRMKEEITGELRQLRANIEKDRAQDRLELKLLQHKHVELQEDLAKAKEDRNHIKAELESFTETAKRLKQQIDSKQAEVKKMGEKNRDLEGQLKTKTGHLENEIRQKQTEKEELEASLQTKDAEYRRLQGALERLKEEHEERHGRLKALTRDKVALEKEVQLLTKDKRNLEVKIRSLEQHIRILQEKHTHETEDIRQQIDRQATLLEAKERERQDLQRKLEDRVRENENIKREKLSLEEHLQKTQNENANLQIKLKQADLSKYALPPFLTSSRSSRTGWHPKNLKR
ncbi:myosin heavy chain, skeletal muscle-like [Dreissena polymorpha]|uniref:CARD domain-containing protein n=1 Tax=Dreissena polymorpha TaxID=45954 RepID=A0A9D4RQ78_DREPO|nr:myosin heavy chain, skeletal muscle-like [Dreissena polymorpha]KAH3876884.1 hypothetical protein DPMN_000735 [Dreissena polymorpha]